MAPAASRRSRSSRPTPTGLVLYMRRTWTATATWTCSPRRSTTTRSRGTRMSDRINTMKSASPAGVPCFMQAQAHLSPCRCCPEVGEARQAVDAPEVSSQRFVGEHSCDQDGCILAAPAHRVPNPSPWTTPKLAHCQCRWIEGLANPTWRGICGSHRHRPSRTQRENRPNLAQRPWRPQSHIGSTTTGNDIVSAATVCRRIPPLRRTAADILGVTVNGWPAWQATDALRSRVRLHDSVYRDITGLLDCPHKSQRSTP